MNRIQNVIWDIFATIMPQIAVRVQYRYILKRHLNLNNPRDLNEKINYLKFYANQEEWARLSDKYAVRKYVEERGLDSILIPLYGVYDTPQDMLSDWSNLPDKFVIKSNHGCGTVKIIKDKNQVDKKALYEEMSLWLKQRYGRSTVERHYLRIKPCLIIEEYMEDKTVLSFSKSIIDYKIWCFNGKPYSICVVVDRDLTAHKHSVSIDEYNLNWERVEHAMTGYETIPKRLAKPQNFERLLQCAEILSKGHKQVRVDLYDIEGNIYFGEMTFTSQGGYMNYFTPEFLMEMGNQFEVK